MIYDCFSFFNELDLLEIRLNVLKDVVDKFVLVEATRTHTGSPKPLYFKDNAARFSAFADRIVHIVVDDFAAAESCTTVRERAWAVENLQRNAIARGLAGAHAGDIVAISDLDEIPDPQSLLAAADMDGITRLGMMQCNYFLNYRNYTSPEWRLGTQVLSYGDFINPETYESFRFNEFVVEAVHTIPNASAIRFMRPDHLIHNGGWHFSYQGGAAMISKKIQSIAHTEFANDKTCSEAWIMERIERGEDVFLRGDRFFAEPLDERFPFYLLQKQDRYSKMILPVSSAQLRETAWLRKRAICLGMLRRALIACVPERLVPFAVSVRNRMLKSR